MTRDFKRASERVNALRKEFSDEDYRQTQDDFKSLLQLPSFRRVFASIIKKGRVFSSVAFESSETNEVMKCIGWRELAVDIYFTANNADGDMVIEAIKERNAIERERSLKVEQATREETKWKN